MWCTLKAICRLYMCTNLEAYGPHVYMCTNLEAEAAVTKVEEVLEGGACRQVSRQQE